MIPNSSPHFKRKLLLTLAVGLSSAAHSESASVMFSDSDFAGAWRTDTFTSAASASVVHTVETVPVSSSAPSGDFIGIDVETGLLGESVEGFTYDPVMQLNPAFTSSGISSIEFSAEVYGQTGVSFAFALEQNGTHYFGQVSTDARVAPTWVSVADELVEADFVRFEDTTGTGGVHPDFSTAGAPITVGVYSQLGRSQGGQRLLLAPQQLVGSTSLDDFSATFNYAIAPIPEPSAFALLGIAGVAGIFRRRR